MKHEELLDKIYDGKFDYNKLVNALSAIVEIHKPEKMGNHNLNQSYGVFCAYCDNNGYNFLYPCPTIQAIEKELK